VAWTWDLDLELETGGIGCCSVQGQRADCNTWEYEVITTLMPVSMLVLCSLARWSCLNCVATTNYQETNRADYRGDTKRKTGRDYTNARYNYCGYMTDYTEGNRKGVWKRQSKRQSSTR
jgi:hypothetical protein